jgi:hypothetical protein
MHIFKSIPVYVLLLESFGACIFCKSILLYALLLESCTSSVKQALFNFPGHSTVLFRVMVDLLMTDGGFTLYCRNPPSSSWVPPSSSWIVPPSAFLNHPGIVPYLLPILYVSLAQKICSDICSYLSHVGPVTLEEPIAPRPGF